MGVLRWFIFCVELTVVLFIVGIMVIMAGYYVTTKLPSLRNLPELAGRVRNSWIDTLFRSLLNDSWNFMGMYACGLFGIGSGSHLSHFSSTTMNYLIVICVVGALSFVCAKIARGGIFFVGFVIMGFICQVSVTMIACFYHITTQIYDYTFIIRATIIVIVILFCKWYSLPPPPPPPPPHATVNQQVVVINNEVAAQIEAARVEEEENNMDWAKQGMNYATGAGLGLFVTTGKWADMVQKSTASFVWLSSLNFIAFVAFFAARIIERGPYCKFCNVLGLSGFASMFLIAVGIKYCPGFEPVIAFNVFYIVFIVSYWSRLYSSTNFLSFRTNN